GRDTLPTSTQGLPATMSPITVVAYSGSATGCASGTAPAISALAYVRAMAARQASARSDRQTQTQHREQRSKASSQSSQLIDRETPRRSQSGRYQEPPRWVVLVETGVVVPSTTCEDGRSTPSVLPSCVRSRTEQPPKCTISSPQMFMRLVLVVGWVPGRAGLSPHCGPAPLHGALQTPDYIN